MVDKVKIKKWLLFGVAVVGVAMVIFGVVYGIVNDEEEPGVTSSAIIDTTTQSAGPLTTSSSSFESTTQSADLQMIPCFTDSVGASQQDCLNAGCLWKPIEGAPSCYFPPNSAHGYQVVSTEATSTGVRLTLNILESSASPVPDRKTQLSVEVIEYGENMVRIKMTVPDEERYEVPVPLNLPSPERSSSPLYEVSYSGTTDSNFAIKVTRTANGKVIFDSSIGGLTFAEQFLQIATHLPSEEVYGFGEHPHTTFRHNFDWTIWPMFARDQPPDQGNTNLYSVHPVYYVLEDAENAHAVFWFNSNAMEVELIPAPALAMRSIGGVIDLFILLGPSPLNAIQQYTNLVGNPMMPAYWSLGFQLCRYGYKDLDDMKDAVYRTRRHGIPQDVQYGDIDMMDRQLDFTVDPINFPGLPDFITEVKEDGLRFIVILDPAINAELDADFYPTHERATTADVYVKWGPDYLPTDGNFGNGDVMLGYVWPENRTAFPDFFKNSTADWWVEEIKIFYDSVGVKFDGLWIDMNEPANFGTNEDRPHNFPPEREDWSLHCEVSPLDDPPYATKATPAGKRISDKTLCMIGVQGNDGQFLHYDVHNLYGWAQSEPTLRALYETTGARGLVISRSTFPSSGKWVGHWLGDNISSWKHLRMSIIGMIEFNMFGIPYVGADMCGFFEDTTEALCARWMQVGAFYPYSRNHNGNEYRPQDPGRWPLVGRVSREALRVRYSLLPLLYTLHFQAHRQGLPVVRSLAFQFPQDSESRGVDYQFMWGEGLMFAPVVEEFAEEVEVRFPSAGRWYAFHGGAVMTNVGRTLTVQSPLEGGKVPIFVNGGHILPVQRPASNTMRARTEPLGLVVAPTESGQAFGTLYWDDGELIDAAAKGEYFLANFTYEEDSSSIQWRVVQEHPASTSSLVVSDLEVFSVKERPHQILVGGDRVGAGDWHYDSIRQVLYVYDLNLAVGKDFEVSWSTNFDLPLPCPISFKVWDGVSALTQAECEDNNCVWSPGSQVQCQLGAPDSVGYTIAGPKQTTETGLTIRLQRMDSPALHGTAVENLVFEVVYVSNQVLRFKLSDSDNERYEVPFPPFTQNSDSDGESMYEVVLESEEIGDVFSFVVRRREEGTVLFDTRLGGLVFEDQFLSVTSLLPSKNIYGLGENNHQSLKLPMDGKIWSIFSRGQKPQIDGEQNLYGAHPFYECIENDGNAHGVLLLNSNPMDYQLLDYPSLTLRTIGGILDFFVFLGPSPEDVMKQYSTLVGRPTMPPYWGLGFHLSKQGYASVDEMREVVNRNRALGVPQDVHYGDVDYMAEFKDFTLSTSFQDLPAYVTELNSDGVRFMIVLDPGINAESPTTYETHERAMASSVYIEWATEGESDVTGNGMEILGYSRPNERTAFPSWLKTSTETWWTNEIHTFYDNLSFDGIWLENNEPSTELTNAEGTDDKPDPLACPVSKWDDPPYLIKAALTEANGRLSDSSICLAAVDDTYRHYDVHNLYGLAQSRVTLRGLRSKTSDRGLVVSRSTYPGSGQWGGHWAGENESEWPFLKSSIISILEFNIFGIPFVGAPICGQRGTASEELCRRWSQLGAFYPYSRNHNGAGNGDQDPAFWPESVGEAAKEALLIRYRLLPYLYTLFYEAATTGTTVARPLAHEFPSDRTALSVDDQFLWGSALMISPILEPSVTGRQIYFPLTNWYDFYTGSPVHWLGETQAYNASEGQIPLHLKGGVIIPTQEPDVTTELSRANPMGLIVALDLDRKAEGLLFWDDLSSIDTITLNRFGRIVFAFNEDTLTVTVTDNHNEDLGSLKLGSLEFFGIEQNATAVTVEQDTHAFASSFNYDQETLRLSVTLSPEPDLNKNMVIRLEDIWWDP